MLPSLTSLTHTSVSAHHARPQSAEEVSLGKWFERELSAMGQAYKNGLTEDVVEEKVSALFDKVWRDQNISIDEFEQVIEDFEQNIGVKTSIAQWLRAKMKIWKEALKYNETLTREKYRPPFRKYVKPKE